MARLTLEEWAECRKMRETTGMSFRLLGERFGVSDVAVMKRSRKEQWGDGGNANEIANRLATESAAGIVADKGNNFAARATSINEAAEKKAALIRRQQEDWEEHRRRFDAPKLAGGDGEDLDMPEPAPLRVARLRDAKTAAEMLKVRHEGERRAYGITDEGEARHNSGKPLSAFYGA